MSDDHNEAMSQLPHKLATLIKCLPQAPFRDHLAAECIKQAERIAELEKMQDESSDVEASLRSQIAVTNAERDQLRAELETERMRLVACGVVAMANTAESAAKARDMHPDYLCASVRDVAAAVDREMALRAEVERLRNAMTAPTIEPNSQNWAGMDGAIAFHLIERHADSWADAGRMMSEWREANDTARKATQ